MTATTFGSWTARRALAASPSLVQRPVATEALSRSRYCTSNDPTRPPASSMASRMPRTIASLVCLAGPVRGRLETITTFSSAGGRQPTTRPPSSRKNAAKLRVAADSIGHTVFPPCLRGERSLVIGQAIYFLLTLSSARFIAVTSGSPAARPGESGRCENPPESFAG